MENLSVDNPCPMMLMRMSASGDSFTCKSCKKEVIDFRGKSQQEILEAKSNGATCGVFNAEQLQGQQRMSFFRQSMFYALTVLSFLGFNVSPLNAAPQKQNRLSGQTEINQAEPKQEKEKKKEKKKTKKQKKLSQQKRIVIGSF